MKAPHHKGRSLRSSAFTRLELVITVLLLVVMVFILLSVRKGVRGHADPVECGNNLKHIGLALRIWANDHDGKFPTMVSTNLGGSQEYAETGQVFRHYLSLSNQLGSPLKLACPADSRRASRDWDSLTNSNISYFMSLDAEDRGGDMFLIGDRHLESNPSRTGSLLVLTPKTSVHWGSALHGEMGGNLVPVDGSAQPVYTADLAKFVQKSLTKNPTNRLEFP